MQISVKTIVNVCVTVLVAGILLAFAAGGGPGGFLSLFQEAQVDNFTPPEGETYKDNSGMDFMETREKPVIQTKNHKVLVNESHPAASFVESVSDADGADLTGKLKAKGAQLDNSGYFKADTPGTYIITFSVTDSYGIKAEKNIRIVVEH